MSENKIQGTMWGYNSIGKFYAFCESKGITFEDER